MAPSSIMLDRPRLKVLMAKAGLSSYDKLADASGVHANTLVRALKSEGFQSKTLEKLAAALSCNPLELLTVEGYPDAVLGTLGQALTAEEIEAETPEPVMPEPVEEEEEDLEAGPFLGDDDDDFDDEDEAAEAAEAADQDDEEEDEEGQDEEDE